MSLAFLLVEGAMLFQAPMGGKKKNKCYFFLYLQKYVHLFIHFMVDLAFKYILYIRFTLYMHCIYIAESFRNGHIVVSYQCAQIFVYHL